MTSKFNTLRANLPAERENKMKTAKEIFIEVWKEWFGDEDNDQLNIALKHDYIFESMERYKQVSVEPEVSDDFGEPEIDEIDFHKWLSDRMFYSETEGTPIDKHILENYFDTVEQFIKSPSSKAAKSVFEIATQTIKKYLSQNSG